MAKAFPEDNDVDLELPVESGAPWPGRYMLLMTRRGAFMQSIAVDPSKAGVFTDVTLDHLFRDATIENRLLLFTGQESDFTFGNLVLYEETPDGDAKLPTKSLELEGIMLRTNRMNETERAGVTRRLHFGRIRDITSNQVTLGYLATGLIDNDIIEQSSFRKIKSWIPETGNKLVLRLRQDKSSSSARFVDVPEFPGLLQIVCDAEPIEVDIPPRSAAIDPKAIYVSGLPAVFNHEDMLRATFGGYGRILSCKPSKNSREKAFISFGDHPRHGAIDAVNYFIQRATQENGIVVRRNNEQVRLTVERVILPWEVAKAKV